MDCVEADGVTYVVTASENGTIRVWDLERTTELRRFTVRDDEAARSAAERGMKTLVAGLACTRLHGDVLIVGCAPDGSAWVRDLLSGEVRRRLPGLSSWESDLPVVCLEAQETAMAFVRSPAGVLRRWDLETGEWAHLEDVVDCMAVAISVQDGCTLVSLGYRDGRLQFRDPTTDAVVSSCRVGQGWVTAMAFTELDGLAVMVVGYADGSMELRDQRGGRLLARLNGHVEWIHFIAVTCVAGRPMVASSDSRGSVRLWALEEQSGGLEPSGHSSTVSAVACTVLNGAAVTLSVSHDHTGRVWDLASGRELLRLEGHTHWVAEVACVTVAGSPVALTSGHDNTVRVWDLEQGAETGRIEAQYSTP
ncbi:hypothetical protein ABZ943_40715, partial [Streptomyces rubiginosohelvolus]